MPSCWIKLNAVSFFGWLPHPNGNSEQSNQVEISSPKSATKLQIANFSLGSMMSGYFSPFPAWRLNMYTPLNIIKLTNLATQNIPKGSWSVFQASFLVRCELLSRWWFQTFFIFTLTWGDDPI